jgi:molybdate transport system substrate-binding protein
MIRVSIYVAIFVLLSGCAVSPVRPSTSASGTLTVFAAASLTEAFTALGQRFEADHPGVRVTFNFAGSQQLAQQLAQGAPADLFASAHPRQMQAAIDASRVLTGTTRPFACNRLVVIYPGDNPAGLRDLRDLAQPGLHLVIAAKEVPVGQYALDFLGKADQDPVLGAGYRDRVLRHVVSYEENVKAVLAKVILGEADAGIVYTTDLASSQPGRIGQIAIPDALNVIATYPIGPVRDGGHPDLARLFMEEILGPAGQVVLAKYGFIPAAACR